MHTPAESCFPPPFTIEHSSLAPGWVGFFFEKPEGKDRASGRRRARDQTWKNGAASVRLRGCHFVLCDEARNKPSAAWGTRQTRVNKITYCKVRVETRKRQEMRSPPGCSAVGSERFLFESGSFATWLRTQDAGRQDVSGLAAGSQDSLSQVCRVSGHQVGPGRRVRTPGTLQSLPPCRLRTRAHARRRARGGRARAFPMLHAGPLVRWPEGARCWPAGAAGSHGTCLRTTFAAHGSHNGLLGSITPDPGWKRIAASARWELGDGPAGLAGSSPPRPRGPEAHQAHRATGPTGAGSPGTAAIPKATGDSQGLPNSHNSPSDSATTYSVDAWLPPGSPGRISYIMPRAPTSFYPRTPGAYRTSIQLAASSQQPGPARLSPSRYLHLTVASYVAASLSRPNPRLPAGDLALALANNHRRTFAIQPPRPTPAHCRSQGTDRSSFWLCPTCRPTSLSGRRDITPSPEARAPPPSPPSLRPRPLLPRHPRNGHRRFPRRHPASSISTTPTATLLNGLLLEAHSYRRPSAHFWPNHLRPRGAERSRVRKRSRPITPSSDRKASLESSQDDHQDESPP